jgi:uncharacterized protein with NRDE domain
MCLLVLAWQAHPRYQLIVAANRDEYHERPTAPMAKWATPDEFIAGRDLRAGGTWLGVDRARRFGIVTNFRELQRPVPDAPSRGHLIPSYLRGTADAERYLGALEPAASSYSGFNLLLSDRESLWYGSNRAEHFARPLSPGIYGLSNHFLDTPWPKLRRVRRRFEAWISSPEQGTTADLFSILEDPTPAGIDETLPQTGLAPERERLLSAPFIKNPEYGTRCSSVLMMEPSGTFYLAERRFTAEGNSSGDTEYRLGGGQWL